MDPEGLLLQELESIDRIIAFTCRRHRLVGADADDFASAVKLRLVENDYAILRGFRGRSSFTTYISVVIQRMLLDHRIHEWGKWHPSAEARRIGEGAMRLEQLIRRDGHTVDEALVILRADDPAVTRESLMEIATRLPQRDPRRRNVQLQEAQSVHAAGAADTRALDGERERIAARVSRLLRRFVDALPPEDRLLLQLRFDSEMTVAQIARALQTGQKPLYRRIEKLLRALRTHLQSAGIDRSDIDDLVGREGSPLDFRLRNATARPSADDGGVIAAGQEEIPR